MIQPGNYDITIQQGADWEKTFQLFDSQNDPINLTGSIVEAEIWLERKKAKLADFTVTIINALTGQFKISLSNETTSNLLQDGYYDIKITDVYGFSNYWVRGQAILDVGYTE